MSADYRHQPKSDSDQERRHSSTSEKIEGPAYHPLFWRALHQSKSITAGAKSAPRARALLGMQRTYGNKTVQRLMQPTATDEPLAMARDHSVLPSPSPAAGRAGHTSHARVAVQRAGNPKWGAFYQQEADLKRQQSGEDAWERGPSGGWQPRTWRRAQPPARPTPPVPSSSSSSAPAATIAASSSSSSSSSTASAPLPAPSAPAAYSSSSPASSSSSSSSASGWVPSSYSSAPGAPARQTGEQSFLAQAREHMAPQLGRGMTPADRPLLGQGQARLSSLYLGAPGMERDMRLAHMDPRMQRLYPLHRESDQPTPASGSLLSRGLGWAKNKAEGVKETASGVIEDVTHGRFPGDPGRPGSHEGGQFGENMGRTLTGLLWRGAGAAASAIPGVSLVTHANAAINETERIKQERAISNNPQASPLAQQIATGRKHGHQAERRGEIVGTAAGAASPAVTMATYGVPGAQDVVGNVVSNLVTGGEKAAHLALGIGRSVKSDAGALRRDAASMPQSSSDRAEYEEGVDRANAALMQLPPADPEHAQALLRHLAPPRWYAGQGATGEAGAAGAAGQPGRPDLVREMASINYQQGRDTQNLRGVSQPTGVHYAEPNLKPSEVANMTEFERARLHLRSNLGAPPDWNPLTRAGAAQNQPGQNNFLAQLLAQEKPDWLEKLLGKRDITK